MMEMCPSSSRPYLLLLAALILSCFVIAIPGVVAAIQIQLQRRDLSRESPEVVRDPRSTDHLSRMDDYKHMRTSRTRLFSTEITNFPTAMYQGNIVSHDTRTSRRLPGKFISEREDAITEANLVLLKPDSGNKAPVPVNARNINVLTHDVKMDTTSDSESEFMSINLDDYYTYDYDDYLEDEDIEDEEEEEEEDDEYVVFADESRSKKDASGINTDDWRSLQRLAELATHSNADLRFVNLITPNPDLDITIEVVTDDEEDEMNVDNELPDDDKPPRLPPPRRGDPSAAGLGEWGQWSSCSASCGGGVVERKRTCGPKCSDTESQECNIHRCLGHSMSSHDTDDVSVSGSTTPSYDETFRIDHGFTIDVVDEISDVIDTADFDRCEEWLQCRSEKLVSYLSRLRDLPSCPCFYPTTIIANDAIFDRQTRTYFQWVDLGPETSRLSIYKPTAAHCIQSLLSQHSTSLASQQCCYDAHRRLITRGQGAGTPQLISAELSRELNYKIDILPWIICKGDWTKYNRVRPPNNGRDCRENPDMITFLSQVDEARDF